RERIKDTFGIFNGANAATRDTCEFCTGWCNTAIFTLTALLLSRRARGLTQYGSYRGVAR
ncbi:hypothetical protein, partial [Salmonella enterica]|uniref:hypothetical protein n=1 Tax=Salmonella enterica TaxID=28901 RepID=UPI003EDC2007